MSDRGLPPNAPARRMIHHPGHCATPETSPCENPLCPAWVELTKANYVDPFRCPKCYSKLAIRNNRKTGEQFYGCPRFPRCRGTRPMAAQ